MACLVHLWWLFSLNPRARRYKQKSLSPNKKTLTKNIRKCCMFSGQNQLTAILVKHAYIQETKRTKGEKHYRLSAHGLSIVVVWRMFATTTNRIQHYSISIQSQPLSSSSSSSCIYFLHEAKVKTIVYMDIIEFFAAFFIALLSTLSFFCYSNVTYFREVFLGWHAKVEQIRWRKNSFGWI